MKPIVLAFSGGLDTSWAIPYLAETTGRPVATVTVDTGGFDAAARAELAARAATLGAIEHRMLDALAARELGSTTVAHGSTAAGNDQVRFEVALRTLEPGFEILAPVRDSLVSRAAQVAFLHERGLPVPAHGAAYSVNRGLWGTTIGGSETKTSQLPLPEAAWVATRGAFDRPLAPARHTLTFEEGIPVAFDGESLDPVALIERVESTAAPFGRRRKCCSRPTVSSRSSCSPAASCG